MKKILFIGLIAAGGFFVYKAMKKK